MLHLFAFERTQSGDMTVATWGGSTADNMESIEEDENDSGDGQEADDGEFTVKIYCCTYFTKEI